MKEEERICAIATAPGEGAIAVVRVSGKGSWEVLASMVGLPLSEIVPRYFYYKPFVWKGECLDEGFIVFFKAPESYTGEEMAELFCHGGFITPQRILQALKEAGFRLAQPGEFTKRRVLHHKSDLMQAESLYQLVHAKTERAQKEALKMWQGKGSQALSSIRAQLYALLSHLEVVCDYPEEGIQGLEQEKLLEALSKIRKEIASMLQSEKGSYLLSQGLHVVIAGPPNSGKSTLFNLFCGKEKALVTPFAGTTRDVLEHPMEIGGVPVILKDTAGLRDTDEQIELLGIEKACAAIRESHVVLWVFDLTAPSFPQEGWLREHPVIFIGNKADLIPGKAPRLSFPYLPFSAKQGTGLEELEEKIKEVTAPFLSHLQFFLSQRQLEILKKADQELQEIEEEAKRKQVQDLLALSLRGVLQHFAELTGECVTEQLLHQIFAHFCVGK